MEIQIHTTHLLPYLSIIGTNLINGLFLINYILKSFKGQLSMDFVTMMSTPVLRMLLQMMSPFFSGTPT